MDKPTDKLIYRVAEIWGRQLHNPKFDNGDDSATGALGHGLQAMLINSDISKTNDIESKVKVFVETLADRLIKARDSEDHLTRFLNVDYHPCKELSEAAEVAGIPDSLFGCKNDTYLMDNHVSASFGYAAEPINHYPLSNGKWLVTTLKGTDDEMQKVFNNVIAANDLDLLIEANHG